MTAQNSEAKRAEGEKKARLAETAERERAVKAEAETAKQAEEITHQLGISRVILAETAFGQHDVMLTAEWLSKVPVKQQGWAWRYFKQQSQGGLFTLRGHKYPVTCVAFSPDSRKLVTGGAVAIERFRLPNGLSRSETVGQAKVWDAQTGKVLLELKGLGEPVECVAFSPDGKRVMTAGQGPPKSGTQGVRNTGVATVWNAQTGEALLELEGLTDGVNSVAFSPDGTRIVTREVMGTVKVWDAKQAGKPLLDLKGIATGRSTVSFSPDGTRIVTGNGDRTAIVLDAATGKILLQLKGQTRVTNIGVFGIVSSAFSPDGTRIVTGGGSGAVGAPGRADVTVWNARTGEVLLELIGHSGPVMSVSFSPDGEQILTGSRDATAKVWDARTGSGRLTLKGHNSGVLSVAISSDGTRIVSGGGEMRDDTSAYFAASKIPGEATVWNALTGEAVVVLKGIKGSINSVAFGPNGKRVVTAGLGPPKPGTRGNTGAATVWNAQTGEALLELEGLTDEVHSVAFSPDGTRIVTTGSHDWLGGLAPGKGTELKIWDAQTGKVLHDLTEQTPAKYRFYPALKGGCAAFSPDGNWIVAGGLRRRKANIATFVVESQSVASLWNAKTGKHVLDLGRHSNLGRHSDSVTSVAFSPDGMQVITGSVDRTAKVWDPKTGKLLFALKGHQGSVKSVAFSPDGRQIITGSADRTVRVWDAKTETTLVILQGQLGIVTSVAFSRDGKTIVTGGGEVGKPGEVTVWNAHPEPVAKTQGLLQVKSFSPDGNQFILSHQGVKLFDTNTGTILCSLKSSKGFGDFKFDPGGTRIVGGRTELFHPENGVISRTIGFVNVWDAKTGNVLRELKGIQSGVSRDGTRFVTTMDGDSGKQKLKSEAIPPTVPPRKHSPDGHYLARVNGNTVELMSLEHLAGEIAYRRLHTRPKWERYREHYLAARRAQAESQAEGGRNDFVAGFYLNLIPPGNQPALIGRGDTVLIAGLTKRVQELRRSAAKSQAIPLLERIVAIQKTKLGPDHLDTLKTMTLLGLTYRQTDQLDASIDVLKQLLKLSEAKHGRSHLQTQQAIAHLGASYLKTDDQSEAAIPLLEEAHRSLQKHPQLQSEDSEAGRFNPPGLPWVSSQMLNAYVKADQTKQAVTIIKEISAILRTRVQHSTTQGTLFSGLAQRLVKLNAVTEAESLLRECLAIQKKSTRKFLSAGHPLVRTMEELIGLHEEMGKKDEATKWRKELKAILPVPIEAKEKK